MKLKTSLVGVVVGLAFALTVIFSPSTTQSQTNAELLTLITSLLNQISQLQTQIAGQQGGTGAIASYNFAKDLRIGAKGTDVTNLQKFLVAKGFLKLSPTAKYGTFGPLTQNAVAAYQRSKRITPAAGVFGPKTRAVANVEARTLASTSGSGVSTTGSVTTTGGVGGIGNAVTTRRTGGGGGSRRTSSGSNPTPDPTPQPSAQCTDGNDNDGDGLTDFPIDPECSSRSGASESGPPVDRKTTYAFRHFVADDNSSNASYNLCDQHGNSNSYTCTPLSMGYDNIIYPWVLSWEQANSMDVNKAKAYLATYPDGARGMFVWTFASHGASQHDFFDDADNCSGSNQRCPWQDNWLNTVRTRTTNFFRDFKAAGGDVDVVILDNEAISDLSNLDSTRAGRILANPKYSQTQTSPIWNSNDLAYGPMQSRLSGLSSLLSDPAACAAANCYAHASFFLRDWAHSYWNKALFEPIQQYFPSIAMSNHFSYAYDFDTFFAPFNTSVTSCIPGAYCSNWEIFGNRQEMSLMNNMTVYSQSLDGVRPYAQNSFNKIKEYVNWAKVAFLSAPDKPLAPLFNGSRYSNGSGAPAGAYAEVVYHILLSGADFLQMWHDNPRQAYEERDLSLAMRDFDKIAGFADKNTLVDDDTYLANRLKVNDKSAWGDDYILTGMDTGGRTVWRFTPQTGTDQIPNIATTLISTDPPTFVTGQYTITFPDGVIYTPQSSQSSLGYWIVQPAGGTYTIVPDSPINIPPIACMYFAHSPEAPGHVLIGSDCSLDPDGTTLTRAFDFDEDGDYGDGEGDMVRDFNGNPVVPVSPAWFMYRYPTTGTKIVGLKVTDADNVSTTIRYSIVVPPTACSGLLYEPVCALTATLAVGEGTSNFALAWSAITAPIESAWDTVVYWISEFFLWLFNFFKR